MVRYTLAQSPEIAIDVPGKDSAKAREKAMSQLVDLMDAGKLDTDLADGFSPDQLIEVKETSMSDVTEREDPITQAVQVLNNFATLKIKVQELRAEAMKVRAQVDILFRDEPITQEQIDSLKEGFKALKNFAQINMRYLELRSQAEEARTVLDRALQSPTPEPTPEKPKK
jgi:alcohol dehydrogenase class IV